MASSPRRPAGASPCARIGPRGVVRVGVTDDGVGLDPDTAGDGVGIANVRERLRATFGERGRLALTETPGGGVSAELLFPARLPADAEAR